MVGFFQELAKKLAERWLTLLLVPGALLLAAVWTGVRLGHADAVNWTRLNADVTDVTASLAKQPGGTQAVLAVAVLLGATGAGLVVQALAGVTRALWLGLWPRPFGFVPRPLVASRQRRWRGRLAVRRELEKAHPSATRTAEQQEKTNTAAARLNRLAPVKPVAPPGWGTGCTASSTSRSTATGWT